MPAFFYSKNMSPYNLVCTVAPTEEPVTRAEAKLAAQIDDDITDQDIYIDGLITAARVLCEHFTNRAFMPQTWLKTWRKFPHARELQCDHAPVTSVSSLKYYDPLNNLITMSTDLYQVDLLAEPGLVVLEESESWPTEKLDKVNCVQLTYVAGYANAEAVPEGIKTAIKQTVAHWYNNREAVVLQYSVARKLPWGIDNILYPYALRRF